MSVRLAGSRFSTECTSSAPSRSEVKYLTPFSTSWWYKALPEAILNFGDCTSAPDGVRILIAYVPGERKAEKFSS